MAIPTVVIPTPTMVICFNKSANCVRGPFARVSYVLSGRRISPKDSDK